MPTRGLNRGFTRTRPASAFRIHLGGWNQAVCGFQSHKWIRIPWARWGEGGGVRAAGRERRGARIPGSADTAQQPVDFAPQQCLPIRAAIGGAVVSERILDHPDAVELMGPDQGVAPPVVEMIDEYVDLAK